MKKIIYRLSIGSLLFITALFLQDPLYKMILFGIAYIVLGYDIIFKAIRNILNGKIFDENFLMSIATIGAITIGEYPEAVGVMLFYQFGEAFQHHAVNKSRKSIKELMNIRPDYARLYIDGKTEIVDPEEIREGALIQVNPGERVPLDAVVIEGNSMLDTSALTGESVPKNATKGDEVLSGCINKNGVLILSVLKEFSQSTVSRILEIVEEASENKSKSENFITKFAEIYTPFVVISAVLLATIPPLLIKDAVFSNWLYRALTFLVVSCPCALVISIPLSFFGGIGGASRNGILVKGSNYLEMLSHVDTVVFDKTGTLTKGTFSVQEIKPISISKDELLEIAATIETHSSHPIAVSLKEKYGKEIDSKRLSDIEEISGHGIKAKIDGKTTHVGNAKLMNTIFKNFKSPSTIGTVVHVSQNDKYLGYIIISDEIKTDSETAIKDLKRMGIKKTVMLTGDNQDIGKHVGNKLGIDEIYTELLPQDKVNKEKQLLQNQNKNSKLAFVGDGINDAPVLAMADVGIAMGGVGSDAAIEAADIVIMTDEPSKIAKAIEISKKTLKIVNQNIAFALIVKFSVLILSAFGLSNMWEAVFADVGVSFIAILNAMRALKSN